MLCRIKNIAALLPCFFFVPDAAHALEDEVWGASITRTWLSEHVAVKQQTASPPSSFTSSRIQTWANGVASSSVSAFTASGFDKTVGAKLQPFQDWNLKVGTELTRSSGEDRFLSSKAMWETFWSQDVKRLGGVTIGLSTTGSLDNAQTDYLQSFSGSVNMPLDLPLNAWNMEFRVTPSMNVDVSNGALTSSLLSEVISQKVLSSQDDAFQSTLNVKVGYSLAPDARPAASAKLEFRISPNL